MSEAEAIIFSFRFMCLIWLLHIHGVDTIFCTCDVELAYRTISRYHTSKNNKIIIKVKRRPPTNFRYNKFRIGGYGSWIGQQHR